MTHRERYQACLEHRSPDRAPIDYQAVPALDRRLKGFYGLDPDDAGAERELLDRLGCDFYYLSARDISQNETCLPIWRGPELPMSDTERVCPFGIHWHRRVRAGKFAADEVIRGPLESASSPQDVLDHPWPRAQWFDPQPLLRECEAHAGRVIVGGFWTGIFGHSYRMLGFENFLMQMAMNPELIHTLVDRMTELYLELNERVFRALKGRMDVWYFGNDYGTQTGLLFSEPMWLDFFYENTRRLCGLAHGYGLKVMAHSCGAVTEILPHLIEAGVDILDPVQTTAAGMDPAALKARFGDALVFHGAVDTQQVLPRKSPAGVARHAQELLRVLGRDGGYIFAPCNSIQADTPVENVETMYRTAREYRPA